MPSHAQYGASQTCKDYYARIPAVARVLQYYEGNLFVGLQSGSLMVYNLSKGKSVTLPHPHGRAITAIVVDEASTLWTGSLEGSVNCWRVESPSVISHMYMLNFQDKGVMSLSSRGESVYVAAGRAGSFIIGQKSISPLYSQRYPRVDMMQVLCISEVTWLLLSDGTIVIIDSNTNNVVRSVKFDNERATSMCAIQIDGQELLAIGTSNGSLIIAQQNGNAVSLFRVCPPEIKRPLITSIRSNHKYVTLLIDGSVVVYLKSVFELKGQVRYRILRLETQMTSQELATLPDKSSALFGTTSKQIIIYTEDFIDPGLDESTRVAPSDDTMFTQECKDQTPKSSNTDTNTADANYAASRRNDNQVNTPIRKREGNETRAPQEQHHQQSSKFRKINEKDETELTRNRKEHLFSKKTEKQKGDIGDGDGGDGGVDGSPGSDEISESNTSGLEHGVSAKLGRRVKDVRRSNIGKQNDVDESSTPSEDYVLGDEVRGRAGQNFVESRDKKQARYDHELDEIYSQSQEEKTPSGVPYNQKPRRRGRESPSSSPEMQMTTKGTDVGSLDDGGFITLLDKFRAANEKIALLESELARSGIDRERRDSSPGIRGNQNRMGEPDRGLEWLGQTAASTYAGANTATQPQLNSDRCSASAGASDGQGSPIQTLVQLHQHHQSESPTREELEKLRKRLDEREKDIILLSKEIEGTQRYSEQLLVEKGELQGKLQILEVKYEREQRDMAKVVRRNAKLKARMKEVNRVLGSPGILGKMLGTNTGSSGTDGQLPSPTPLGAPQQQQQQQKDQRIAQLEEEVTQQRGKTEALRSRVVALEADNAALRLKLETKQRLQSDFETQLHNLSKMLDGVTASVTKKKKELTNLIGALASSWNNLEGEIKSRSNYSLFGASPVIAQSQSSIENIMSKIQSEILTFGMN